MINYLIIFNLPIIIFLSEIKFKKITYDLINIYFVILFIFIAFRHGVGGDFYPSSHSLEDLRLSNVLDSINILSNILSLVSSKSGMDIYFYNIFCAFIICFSLYKLSYLFEYKSQLFIISFPILILIVAMGFTKQSASMGCLILSLYFFINNKLKISTLMMIIGTLFHFSLIIFFFIFLKKKHFKSYKKNYQLMIFILFLLITFFLLFYDNIRTYIQAYIYDEVKPLSKGAFQRLIITIFCSTLYIYNRKKILKINKNYYFLDYFVAFSFLLLFILYFLNISTVIDRYNLYLIVIQIFIYSLIIQINKKFFVEIFLFIYFKYFFILLVWIFFANNSFAWFPYENILFKIN